MDADDPDDPSRHPVVQAVRGLLQASHGAAGRVVRDAIEDAAALAHEAATCGAEGDHGAAAECREGLQEQLGDAPLQPMAPDLGRVWAALVDSACGGGGAAYLSIEEVEELVLGYLCALPEFLGRSLVRSLVRQVGLGQGLMSASDRHLDVGRLIKGLEPQLPRHLATSKRIARECCQHLMQRSETIATNVLRRLDVDGDGAVSQEDFLQAAPHALALEVENLATTACVEALLADPDFADDFHPAMAAALGICAGASEDVA